jgi:hypothetical protein
MFIERHEPPSVAPDVTTIDDGPIPTALGLSITAAVHDRVFEDTLSAMHNRLMETALSGGSLLAAVPSADLSRQDHPAAPAEAPVLEQGAPAPIPVSVEPEPPTVEAEELRQCAKCRRWCPLTDFVGVMGQRTRSTCNACCVCVWRFPSTSTAADRRLASLAGAASGRPGHRATGRARRYVYRSPSSGRQRHRATGRAACRACCSAGSPHPRATGRPACHGSPHRRRPTPLPEMPPTSPSDRLRGAGGADDRDVW